MGFSVCVCVNPVKWGDQLIIEIKSVTKIGWKIPRKRVWSSLGPLSYMTWAYYLNSLGSIYV